MKFLLNPHFGARCMRLFAQLFIILLLSVDIWAAKNAHRPGKNMLKLATHQMPISGQFLLQKYSRTVDEKCRNIHQYRDKCAFVRKYCANEQVGTFDYLEFYYCRLGDAPVVAFGVMAAWLGLLFTTIGVAASDFFCVNLSTIANILGMSESMAGVTFLAFGNGSPDVFSTFAAVKVNSGSLAVGELIGAASFIVAVVAGSMAIVRPFRVAKASFVRDILFFTVAVMFGIYCVADGVISMWECGVMISYYVFYVLFVVAWYWWVGRKRRQRLTECQARDHYTALGEEQPLLGDEGEDGRVGESSRRLGSYHDIRVLETSLSGFEEGDQEDEEQQAYAELNNNMRISWSGMKNLPNTPHSIRPSLIGALEFRSVLHSLNKSQNLRAKSIHLRKYLDDGSPSERYSAPGTFMHNTPVGSIHEGSSYFPSEGGRLGTPQINHLRARAVSVNDAEQFQFNSHQIDPELDALPGPVYMSSQIRNRNQNLNGSQRGSNLNLQVPPLDFLAPLSPDDLSVRSLAPSVSPTPQSPKASPGPVSGEISISLPHTIHTGDTLASPTAMQVPEPHSPSMVTQRSYEGNRPINDSDSELIVAKRAKFWPHYLLPPPQAVFAVLFPTLGGFRDKTVIEKFMALAAMPSILLLTLTLPVVDDGSNSKDEKDSRPIDEQEYSLLPTSPPHELASTSQSYPRRSAGSGVPVKPSPPSGEGDWRRWLVTIQCITSPLFVAIIFSGASTKAILCSLLLGLTALLLVLSFTHPNRPPKRRYLLCFAGFIVSISWISTIANEVVGVLKAIGLILNISDAILGLTIFAVGNSLGDLVADITVARLGFPVMALSACFGGPMLNILLGIGISGLYMSLAHHREGYKIEVSSTLIISAGTLLISLMLLLLAVPMNNWRMSRRIGGALIILWCVSTVINVVLEATGFPKWKGPTWT